MAEIKFEDERKRFKESYEKWGFIRRIVDLYAEGVAWKDCKVIAPTESDKIPSQYSQIIDADAIKDGVCGMLVDGMGVFNLRVLGSAHKLSIHVPPWSFLDDEEGRCSFLWRATINAGALETMLSALGTSPNAAHAAQVAEMVKFLEEDMCMGLGVPRGLLQPNAANADPTRVMWGLITFRGRVEELRKHIAFHMTEAVRPLISKALNYKGQIEVVWNEDWHQSGVICDYGPVYQVFKTQGIELRKLAEQCLKSAKSLLDSSLISRQTYEESVKWFR